MTTQTQIKPAEGNCRWLDIDPVSGNRYLQIDVLTESGWVRQDYEVEIIHPDPSAGRYYPQYRLYRLSHRPYGIVCYTVDTDSDDAWWTCDCGDAVNRRQGQCKHIKALIQAIPQKMKGLIR